MGLSLKGMLEISKESVRLTLKRFEELARQLEEKADKLELASDDSGCLAFTAAASAVRRVISETQEANGLTPQE